MPIFEPGFSEEEAKTLQTQNQPYFLDMVTCETLKFQTMPLELSYAPESLWSAIASSGRNNPLYHYTGSEDTLNFMLTWYADEQLREDVLKKCKWLESLSKNDGYTGKPHHVKLMFGRLFNEATWIVEKAPYKMSLFNRVHKMLPTLAVQEVTLKKITDNNLSYSTMRKIDS